MHTTIILLGCGHAEGIDQPRFRGRRHHAWAAAGMRHAGQSATTIGRHAGGTVAIVGHDTVSRLRQAPACVDVLPSGRAPEVVGPNGTAHPDRARPGNVFGVQR